ncbi:hypothetical protein FGRMN_4638 [Fusarium graminum]|nr:hypothetical protein FGRMN_4638 [Fusarium graminum]
MKGLFLLGVAAATASVLDFGRHQSRDRRDLPRAYTSPDLQVHVFVNRDKQPGAAMKEDKEDQDEQDTIPDSTSHPTSDASFPEEDSPAAQSTSDSSASEDGRSGDGTSSRGNKNSDQSHAASVAKEGSDITEPDNDTLDDTNQSTQSDAGPAQPTFDASKSNRGTPYNSNQDTASAQEPDETEVAKSAGNNKAADAAVPTQDSDSRQESDTAGYPDEETTSARFQAPKVNNVQTTTTMSAGRGPSPMSTLDTTMSTGPNNNMPPPMPTIGTTTSTGPRGPPPSMSTGPVRSIPTTTKGTTMSTGPNSLPPLSTQGTAMSTTPSLPSKSTAGTSTVSTPSSQTKLTTMPQQTKTATLADCPHTPYETTETVAIYTTLCPIVYYPPEPTQYTTSTVYTTYIRTVTECEPYCPDSPYITTESVAIYTTICPVTEVPPPPTISTPQRPQVQPAYTCLSEYVTTDYSTSTVYTSKISTVTPCPHEDVWFEDSWCYPYTTTEWIALSTTLCPEVKTEYVSCPIPTYSPPPPPFIVTSTSISTYYTTKYYTITACPYDIANCPIGQTTSTVYATATTCYTFTYTTTIAETTYTRKLSPSWTASTETSYGTSTVYTDETSTTYYTATKTREASTESQGTSVWTTKPTESQKGLPSDTSTWTTKSVQTVPMSIDTSAHTLTSVKASVKIAETVQSALVYTQTAINMPASQQSVTASH